MKHISFFGKSCFVEFERKVSEHDINTFAELTGDFSPNHMDAEYMSTTPFEKRIAHGALLVGFMSKASSLILEEHPHADQSLTAVSLGYDRIRFIKPVFIGDHISVKYMVDEYDETRLRSYSTIEIRNQHIELVAVASHILKWVRGN